MRGASEFLFFECRSIYLTAWLNREMPTWSARSASRDGLKMRDNPE